MITIDMKGKTVLITGGTKGIGLASALQFAAAGAKVVVQEPDTSSWNCYPAQPAWERLKGAILTAFTRGGGDFDAGQRTFGMLRAAGLEDVHIRAAVIALQDPHPYRRLPIQFAASLRTRILEAGRLTEAELDAAIAECEQIASKPETIILSFIVTQVWGRKAGR